MNVLKVSIPDDREIAGKLLDESNTLKLLLHKHADGGLTLEFELKGSLGVMADKPTTAGGKEIAQTTRDLLAAFFR